MKDLILLLRPCLCLLGISLTGCAGLNPNSAPTPGPIPKSVVFIGASTIQYWGQSVDFPSQQWINRGIAGQLCAQIHARFQADALQAGTQEVFLICGTNDMYPGFDETATLNEISAMVDATRAAKKTIVVGSVMPWGVGPESEASANNYPTRSADVDRFNNDLKAMLESKSVTFVDFRPQVRGEDGHYKAGLTDDGIHPNGAGYALMTPVVKAAL